MTSARYVGGLVAALTLLCAPAALAQSNYRLAPIGGRSQLLGGTGVTFGRDASAAFLNPATAVLIDDQRLSFSVNFYTMSFVYAPRWYTPGPIDRTKFGDLQVENPTMTDIEFNALPSSLCINFLSSDLHVMKSKLKDEPLLRDARLAFCFATVQSQTFTFGAESFNENRNGTVARQGQTLSQSFTRFSAGPTYAIYVSNALALGASLHGSLVTHRSLLTASGSTFRPSTPAIQSMSYGGSRGDSFQLEATLGATLRFGKQTVGMSVKSPSIHVYGVGSANRQYHFEGAGTETSSFSSYGSFVSQAPMRISIGSGLQGDWGLAEVNASYHAPLGSSYEAQLEGFRSETRNGVSTDQPVELALSERARGVVNLAAGAEVFVSRSVSMLSGLSTDVSAVPGGRLQGSLFNYYPYRTHRLAASFGLNSHGNGGELMIGTEVSYGWGDRLAVNSYELPPAIGTTPHSTYQLMLVIAGSTSLNTLKRAVDDVKNVISTPSPHKPASDPTPQKPASDPTPQKPASSPTPQKPLFD